MRKIAANYIFLPGFPLVKNGYVILGEGLGTEVRDTGGQIHELAGLEFYGGLLVPAYVREYSGSFLPGMKMLPFLEQLFAEKGNICQRVAIIEGADLLRLEWKQGARIRLL